MSVNKVILIGNLGQKPELQQSNSGLSICKIRIATSDRRKDSNGEWNNATEWHRVVLFGNSADNAAKYLDKGSQVFIEGRIQTNKWEDKEGNQRYTTEVIANQIKFLSKNNTNNSTNNNSNTNRAYSSESELPF